MGRFEEYLYRNTFSVYSSNNPLAYILTMAKLDATGHRWISKLAPFNFTYYYKSGKSNVEADSLSRILWDKIIKVAMVQAIIKAVVKGPEALMEVYACSTKAPEPMLFDPPPSQIDIEDWI